LRLGFQPHPVKANRLKGEFANFSQRYGSPFALAGILKKHHCRSREGTYVRRITGIPIFEAQYSIVLIWDTVRWLSEKIAEVAEEQGEDRTHGDIYVNRLLRSGIRTSHSGCAVSTETTPAHYAPGWTSVGDSGPRN
jgi:hypothetical protein